jgi:pimeloyl-ACP methyl ester carboxylesterase
VAAFAAAGLGVALGGAVLAGAAYLLRRRKPDPFDPPTNYHIAYQEVSFLSRDGIRLRGWWIPAVDVYTETAHPTIIVCSGQDGSMEGDTAQMVPLHQAGFNVLMFDWRGHGRSDGAMVTMGALEVNDLLGALDFLSDLRGIKRVGVLGFSMGAAVALLTAAESARIAAIVADSGYADLTSVLRRWSAGRGVPGVAVPAIMAAASLISGTRLRDARPRTVTHQLMSLPILYIYGTDDPLVDVEEVEAMLRALPYAVGWRVEGVGHRGTYRKMPVEYNRSVVEWFESTLKEAEAVASGK